MEIKTCKTCGKKFLSDSTYPCCRICDKAWRAEQNRLHEEAEDLNQREKRKHNQELFESEVQSYKPIPMDNITPSAQTLYIIGNGFDLMHRVPSNYYNFRDSLRNRNGLRYSLEMVLTAEDIWSDLETALGSLDLNLVGSRDIIDMWLDNFGFYDDEDSGAAEFDTAVEAAASPFINVVNDLPPAFRKWVNHLEIGTDDRPLVGLIYPEGKVLDFNYTEFIETMYGMKHVCYIHGSRKKKEKLILGHKPGAGEDLYEKERKPRSFRQAAINVAQNSVLDLVGEYDKDLTKDSREIIKNHSAFFNDLAGIDQIIAIGHSISPVDWDYFREIRDKTGDAHWYFGIYGLNDLRNMAGLVKTFDIKNFNVFRTDGIWTKPRKAAGKKEQQPKEINPQVVQNGETSVIIKQTYDFIISDTYEIILPYYAKKVIILENHIFVVLDGPIGNILLFKRQKSTWSFVAELKRFQYQSLINRRLNHIFLNTHDITFVFNNRMRKYDLDTGEMIANWQIKDARSKAYSGKDIINRFVGR